MLRPVLQYPDPTLAKVSEPVAEINDEIRALAQDLLDTLTTVGGVGIAAPQIGVKKRLIYMLLDRPYVIVNPVLSFPDDETFELLDDCMSFPGLLVRVRRYRRCVLDYTDENGNAVRLELSGDMAELIQHEYDHLDGILATMRAVDNKSLYFKV